MSYIPDDRLFSFADRVKGKVVVITGKVLRGINESFFLNSCSPRVGAANGIGKEAALRFAEHGYFEIPVVHL